jgi:hypothetical protein
VLLCPSCPWWVWWSVSYRTASCHETTLVRAVGEPVPPYAPDPSLYRRGASEPEFRLPALGSPVRDMVRRNEGTFGFRHVDHGYELRPITQFAWDAWIFCCNVVGWVVSSGRQLAVGLTNWVDRWSSALRLIPTQGALESFGQEAPAAYPSFSAGAPPISPPLATILPPRARLTALPARTRHRPMRRRRRMWPPGFVGPVLPCHPARSACSNSLNLVVLLSIGD